ncbi:predicted protein [Plenodomus lingam JN3]|uniref:Predicted protein n=1 Tax=Leptosphaeria maculans (strain JN3 / isolate v23.1.3 / race Av1-4-5-6-7-8) TaxID=985895 RepID=E5A2F7_LEPMJ|nr:predicted protein [Plenodomus lingam JN3]CBX97592.1 predicted protein [Plenodomus lingam JN3]
MVVGGSRRGRLSRDCGAPPYSISIFTESTVSVWKIVRVASLLDSISESLPQGNKVQTRHCSERGYFWSRQLMWHVNLPSLTSE